MATIEAEVERLYRHFREVTDGDRVAAASLVAAHVQLAGKPVPIASLTVRQVAERLKVCEWTVRQMVKDGLLLAARLGSGRGVLRFDPAHLDEFMANRTGNYRPAKPLPRRERK